jgi:hypothetical protein
MQKKGWRLLSPLLSALAVLAVTSSVAAQTLSVKPGWDIFDLKLQKGYVVYSLSEQRGCAPSLDLTYILVGAAPNQSFHVTLGVFDAKGPDGVKFFGVPRLSRLSATREGNTAVIESFVVGAFRTDAAGNGQAHFKLDLSKVTPGAYNVQFVWAKLPADGGQGQGYYRTGEKYGQGFAVIKIP